MRQSWVDAQSTLEIAVAGVKAMDSDLTRIQEGHEVELRAEPSNPHDAHAIQVIGWYHMARSEAGHVLGYVPRDWAAVLTADQWVATVHRVLEHEGKRAGLRLKLRRKREDLPLSPEEWQEAEAVVR
jgi:hypothetical protein